MTDLSPERHRFVMRGIVSIGQLTHQRWRRWVPRSGCIGGRETHMTGSQRWSAGLCAGVIVTISWTITSHVPARADTASMQHESPPLPRAAQRRDSVILDEPLMSSSSAKRRTAAAQIAYRRLPLTFEANQGQADARVKFLARGHGYTVFLMPTEAVLTLPPGSHPSEPETPLPSTRVHTDATVSSV